MEDVSTAKGKDNDMGVGISYLHVKGHVHLFSFKILKYVASILKFFIQVAREKIILWHLLIIHLEADGEQLCG